MVSTRAGWWILMGLVELFQEFLVEGRRGRGCEVNMQLFGML